MDKTPRKVGFTSKLAILKKNPVVLLLGSMFIIFSTIAILLSSIIFSVGNDVPKVNYDNIYKNGSATSAKITDIVTHHNTKINDVSPSTISYEYTNNGTEFFSKFNTLSPIDNLTIGSSVDIKYINGDSVLTTLKPLIAPNTFLMQSPFIIIGLIMLFYSFYKLQKEVKLYQYGKIGNGKIINMIPKTRRVFTNIGGHSIIIHYQYSDKYGNELPGKAITTDYSIINDKKRGESIPIFIDPEDESISCMIPKLAISANNWDIKFD